MTVGRERGFVQLHAYTHIRVLAAFPFLNEIDSLQSLKPVLKTHTHTTNMHTIRLRLSETVSFPTTTRFTLYLSASCVSLVGFPATQAVTHQLHIHTCILEPSDNFSRQTKEAGLTGSVNPLLLATLRAFGDSQQVEWWFKQAWQRSALAHFHQF